MNYQDSSPFSRVDVAMLFKNTIPYVHSLVKGGPKARNSFVFFSFVFSCVNVDSKALNQVGCGFNRLLDPTKNCKDGPHCLLEMECKINQQFLCVKLLLSITLSNDKIGKIRLYNH